ncbi:MAG: heparinase II/III domain-containing protein [Candidatus Muiribacteriota bacterium]
MTKLLRLFNTVKYLKFTQIYYRLFYFARARFRKLIGFEYDFSKGSNSTTLELIESCEYYSTYKDGEFSMLNLSKKFDDKIDWNYSNYGKLWTYNLTYFEYLKEKEAVSLIYDFIENISSVKDGLEPFPISLRGMSWIKFLTKREIQDKKIDDSLYAQYYILMDNLEYHLLGNHLLENGFSLLFGAYYFQDEVLYDKAADILKNELDEQILEDGAHFELSPMYHQMMLFRVLDCVNLVQNNSWKKQELLTYLQKKASLMLGWLDAVTFKNGEIPLLNDSANAIAPTSKELFNYANNLQLNIKHSKFKESGYRKITKANYECVVDVGEVGASYIPGHAHADTFNFVLYLRGRPFIIDCGTSTYETGARRDYERSSAAHNTVEVAGNNSSEVWGGFRVADRAEVTDLIEKNDQIKATHDGYQKKHGVLHTRQWSFADDKITVSDSLSKARQAVARLHFHPDVTEEEVVQQVQIKHSKLNIQNYYYADEFNKRHNALVAEIAFDKDLQVEITL